MTATAVCTGCGASLDDAQRYCLECGTRHGPLPPRVVERIEEMQARKRGPYDRGAASDAAAATVEEDAGGTAGGRFQMPGRQSIAVAIMCLFGFGVIIGSATSQSANSAGFTKVLLEEAAEASSATEPEEREPVSEPEPEPEPVSPAPIVIPETLPSPAPEPAPTPTPKPAPPPVIPEPPALPAVKHVFLIVLGDHGYEEAFGPASPATYLAKTLPSQGELLPNYYAVTQGDLANEIALISGQGPTPATAANCPNFTDIVPGTVGTSGQVEGDGCVYPTETETLAGQLAAKGKKWKAYVEDIDKGEPGQPTACRHPVVGEADPNQLPLPGDAYETWRNPLVYFHSVIDGTECGEDDVGLEQLEADLKSKATTPALSYIVPNACHDGGEQPCAPEQPAGLAPAEQFLQTVIPMIKASPAYKDGGLIAITFAQAPQEGPHADPSSCCATPEYPNLAAPPAADATDGPVKPSGGGGRVGLLLISPFVKPGSIEETAYYNHFSLLLSIENLFELEPLGYASNLALSAFESSVFNAQS